MVELYALDCGQLTMPTGTFLEGVEGTMTVPVPAFLIRHPKGTLLFDSGLHDRAETDARAYFGEELNAVVTVHRKREEEISGALASIDVDPARVGLLVNSHLHFDHCGGNGKIPGATVLVQRREWEHANAAETPFGYFRVDFDTGHDVKRLDGEHDVFGDGSVVCFPSYGHTPGHQSLRVRTERGGELVLTGDACYLRETLEKMHAPGVLFDREGFLASLRVFRDLQARGARIVFGHDPEYWASSPHGPERLG